MPKLYGSYDPFKENDYKKLHESTLILLEKTGVYIDHAEILDYCAKAGAKVDFPKKTVRFPADLIERNLKAGKHLLDRRPRPKNLRFSCDGGSGYIQDYKTGKRRDAQIKDIDDLSRLADALGNIDEISFPVFARSIPYYIQDLTIYRHVFAATGKSGGGGLSRNGAVWMNTSDAAIDYLIRLNRVRYGGDTRPDGTPLISGFIGASSPLRFDGEMMQCMMKLIREGQVVGIGSNVIGGAQACATLASVVVMENAERLAAMAIILAINPDAWFYFCNHPNYLDMVSANVANGSPEHSMMAMCATGLLRYYGFQLYANHPVISTGAHTHGVQAAVEKATHALMSGLSGASGVCACGSLFESMSYEQMVIDNEIAGTVKHYLKGLEINDDTIGLDVMEEIGIGGNFLDSDIVCESVHDVYWKPDIWNRKNYSEWERDGSKDALERAHDRVEDILQNHAPRYLTREQEQEMDEIIAEARITLHE